jgi:cyclic pyranopterin phosphate synthase
MWHGNDMELTHLNEKGQPAMVNVGDKAITERTAVAEATVIFPAGILDQLETDWETKKGPVLQTAILAGIMAAKKTPELIPLCHAIPLDHCKVEIEALDSSRLRICCTAKATHKTGVEMEALTGATVAALAIYDMCKALTHEIRIEEIKLLSKRGGKRDVG